MARSARCAVWRSLERSRKEIVNPDADGCSRCLTRRFVIGELVSSSTGVVWATACSYCSRTDGSASSGKRSQQTFPSI